jgi:hypothetical protein
MRLDSDLERSQETHPSCASAVVSEAMAKILTLTNELKTPARLNKKNLYFFRLKVCRD